MNQIVSEKKFIQERLGIPFASLSQAYLRSETQLTTLSSYKFILQRTMSQFTTTVRELFKNHQALDFPWWRNRRRKKMQLSTLNRSFKE